MKSLHLLLATATCGLTIIQSGCNDMLPAPSDRPPVNNTKPAAKTSVEKTAVEKVAGQTSTPAIMPADGPKPASDLPAAKVVAAKPSPIHEQAATAAVSVKPSGEGNEATDPKPANTKGADTKGTEAKPLEVAAVDSKATEAKIADAADSKPADAKPNDAENNHPDIKPRTIDDLKVSDGKFSTQFDFVTGCEPGDCNQWGISPQRNNTPQLAKGQKIPTVWNVGFDKVTSTYVPEKSQNIKWKARVGSETYGNPAVADGKVFIGTNNGAGYVERYPVDVDLGCLLAFNAADGKFLWQHSSEKLPTGRVNDWPNQGICSTSLIEGKRLYYVSSRGEVCCLSTEGLAKGDEGTPDDKPNKEGKKPGKDEADVIWKLDMMKQLGVEQHNMCACSITSIGDLLFVITGNGVDDAHTRLPSSRAPSFLAIDKKNGKLVWADNSPGPNVLHGQWSSPSYAVIDGVPQVLFGGGDGWLYSFLGTSENNNGKPILLWSFDCNPKDSFYKLTGATRNHIIGTPVWYDHKVFIAVGEDPEHGDGEGHLWCIDPTKRGDVSSELVVSLKDRSKTAPRRREMAISKDGTEVVIPNPNSAAVWHYTGNREEPEECMHRAVGSCTIKDDILYIADLDGVFHCLDAQTGKAYWTHDMLAEAWATALVADGHVYIGNADGDVTIFKHAKKKEIVNKIYMGAAVFGTPVFANDVLYIGNRNYLFAIQETKAGGEQPTPDKAASEAK